MKNTDSIISFLAVYRVLLDDLVLNKGDYNINAFYDTASSTFIFNIYNGNVLYYKKELNIPYIDARALKNMIRFHFIKTYDIYLSGIYIKDFKKYHNLCFENVKLNVYIENNELEDTFKVHSVALNKINSKVLSK